MPVIPAIRELIQAAAFEPQQFLSALTAATFSGEISSSLRRELNNVVQDHADRRAARNPGTLTLQAVAAIRVKLLAVMDRAARGADAKDDEPRYNP